MNQNGHKYPREVATTRERCLTNQMWIMTSQLWHKCDRSVTSWNENQTAHDIRRHWKVLNQMICDPSDTWNAKCDIKLTWVTMCETSDTMCDKCDTHCVAHLTPHCQRNVTGMSQRACWLVGIGRSVGWWWWLWHWQVWLKGGWRPLRWLTCKGGSGHLVPQECLKMISVLIWEKRVTV